MTRDELIARAEAAMSDWYGYIDISNPWSGRGRPIGVADLDDVKEWHKLFELLAKAWDIQSDD